MAERILVVDDEEAIRGIVVSMLTSANYKCQQAGSGNEALAVLNSGEQFELIVSDIMMPDLDGIELLQKVKVQYPEIPVIFVTSIHDVSIALVCFRMGVYDYLMEPFENGQLLATTRRALKTHSVKMESHRDKTTLELLLAARTEELRQKLAGLESQNQDVASALRLDDGDAYYGDLMTAFTVAIARTMGLASDQISVISCGASLHDVGQLPALHNILLSPDALLPGELALMCQVSEDIYKMLKAIPFLSEASEIVYASFECFDGTGYPRRLKGDEIPLGARILAVARMAAGHPEIQRRSGHQFDPEVVKAVLSMPENTWEDLRKEVVVSYRERPRTDPSGSR